MELLKIRAKDIQLHDVLGEGQEVWACIKCCPPERGEVTVYFGNHTLVNADFSKSSTFNPFTLVNVLRR